MSEFVKELEQLINKHSKENLCNTPDFILANYLNDCLIAFKSAVNWRTNWWGTNEYYHISKLGDYHEVKGNV